MRENTAVNIIKLLRELHSAGASQKGNFQDVHLFLENLTQNLEQTICNVAKDNGLTLRTFHYAKGNRMDCCHRDAIRYHLQTSDVSAFTAFTEKLRALDIDAAFMVTYGPDGDRTKNTNGYLLKVVFLLDQPFRGRPSVFYGYA